MTQLLTSNKKYKIKHHYLITCKKYNIKENIQKHINKSVTIISKNKISLIYKNYNLPIMKNHSNLLKKTSYSLSTLTQDPEEGQQDKKMILINLTKQIKVPIINHYINLILIYKKKLKITFNQISKLMFLQPLLSLVHIYFNKIIMEYQ